MVIKATSAGFSAGNIAEIYIDDQKLSFTGNSRNGFRGIHIAAIDQLTGKSIKCDVFDTYRSSKRLDEYYGKYGSLKNGNIIVAACKDEFLSNLSQDAKTWFDDMGSSEIW